MKILKKILIKIMIVVACIIAIFYYNMYRYYHPIFIYVVRDNLDKFNAAKDKAFYEGGISNKIDSLDIREFKIGKKTYTLVTSFSTGRDDNISDKIVTFEYFSGGDWDNASDSYGIAYASNVSTLKEGLKHTWWNPIEYHYTPISENWYLLRGSYTELIQSRYGSLFQ